MRKKNLNQRENTKMDERDVRYFGRCENCEDDVTDEGGEYFVNDDGEVFCCLDCALEHHGIIRIEV